MEDELSAGIVCFVSTESKQEVVDALRRKKIVASVTPTRHSMRASSWLV